MKITILGCHAATPRTISNPTSQLLAIRNHYFLIDCGEGTQTQLRKLKVKFSKINHIFISHLHGDHFFGLIGLVSTFGLLNRLDDLHIHGPKGIKEIIVLQLRLSNSWTNYKLYFHELESDHSEVVYEDEKVVVSTIPLVHRVYANGYLFREKVGARKLNVAAAESFGIDKSSYHNIKLGRDIQKEDGSVIENKLLTFDPEPVLSYAFCSDTVYNEKMISLIKDVDILYHESTFLDNDEAKAEKTKHSTAKQAATIALKANAKRLILGHYSTRYTDLTLFQQEAQAVFNPVYLAEDGMVFSFKN